MPSRTWFMLAGLWFAGALAWFSWTDFTAVQDAASVACGRSHVPQAEFATCMAMMQSPVSAAKWNLFFAHDCLWALLPAVAIVMLGAVMTRFRRRRAYERG